MYEGFRNYQSPFDIEPSDKGSHWGWCFWRDRYAETGSPADFERMLERVTMDNPPFPHKIRKSYPGSSTYIGCTIIAVAWVIFTIFILAGAI